MYLIFINDSLENYEKNHPFNFKSFKSDSLSDRICLIQNNLLQLNGINEVFVIIVLGFCGNLKGLNIKKTSSRYYLFNFRIRRVMFINK